MNSKELIECLLRAKNQEAEVRITDQFGSYNVGVFTVEGGGSEDAQPGDEDDVLIIAEPYPSL